MSEIILPAHVAQQQSEAKGFEIQDGDIVECSLTIISTHTAGARDDAGTELPPTFKFVPQLTVTRPGQEPVQFPPGHGIDPDDTLWMAIRAVEWSHNCNLHIKARAAVAYLENKKRRESRIMVAGRPGNG